MGKFLLFILFFLLGKNAISQNNNSYNSLVKKFQKNYVQTHEVVKGKNRKKICFFPVSEKFKLHCIFIKSLDTNTISIKTSGKAITQKNFIRYGTAIFTINDTALQLTVFQSKPIIENAKYKDYLFIPFTDVTTGNNTYGSGRYIDILTTEINNNELTIDFNKAYNPYCAYANGFNCPIPPKENFLKVAILAGEKNYNK